jgi:molybdopterin synthase catalytic subunit
MNLTVRLFAVLRERARAGELALRDLPDALDARGLKLAIERRHPELGSLAHVRVVVGTSYVAETHAIRGGDEVSLLPPVSGGAPTVDDALLRGVFELSAEALDPDQCSSRVVHASCGAVVTFTGTTRAKNREKDVVELQYEAFEAMTGAEMTRIFERCRRELAADEREHALRMLCRHRVGTVRVGEPSVVIAVASPHRDLAFRACRYLIDELKKSLPIWKKEIYADGHAWIGDRS